MGPRDERPTQGDQRGAVKFRPTRRVPGRQKASRLPRRRSPSRGTSRRGSKADRHAEGAPNLRERTARRPRGARLVMEEGNPNALSPGHAPREGLWYLCSRRVDPRRMSDIVSTILGATDGGLRAPPRTRRQEERCPWTSQLTAACCCPGDGVHGATWLAACFPLEGGGLSQAARLDRGGREAEANVTGKGGNARRPARARIGRSRSCSRVGSDVAEVVRRCSAQRSERSPLHPIWKRSGTGA